MLTLVYNPANICGVLHQRSSLTAKLSLNSTQTQSREQTGMVENNIQQSERTSLHGHWSSRFAFVLAVSGSAVGLGNIWKFPYVAGQNGGGGFVLV